MKIAIVGAGPSGLAFYLHLQEQLKRSVEATSIVEVKIFETHDSNAQVPHHARETDIPSSGGGYGLAPNGMASLRRLNPSIHRQVFQGGYPTPRVQFQTSRGWIMGSLPWVDTRREIPECTVMVLRETLLRALRSHVPAAASSELYDYRKVTAIEDGEAMCIVTLADGKRENFDLVIGADGIWSKARKAISNDTDSHPEYRGLFTVAGFVPTEHFLSLPWAAGPMPAPQSATVMVFGPNGFFGYTPYQTAPEMMGKITQQQIQGENAVPPGAQGFWWSRSAQEDPSADLDAESMMRDLKKRAQSWKCPAVHRILANSEIVLKQPTWTLPKQETWAGHRIVLIGDAAHALPSSSGQGVSQALEDAEALAALLTHNLSGVPDPSDRARVSQALQRTYRQYMSARKAHVEAILDAGNRNGDTSRDMNVVQEFFMYGFLTVLCRLFPGLAAQRVTEYDLIHEVEKARDVT